MKKFTVNHKKMQPQPKVLIYKFRTFFLEYTDQFLYIFKILKKI
ncbi:hypothetical protein SAMN05444143_10387 [Flavobacterium succinicans]|uniref:Uncharacterized protein n=1 Tax=Flavobacterium succinicans TaxID=29536 RepID=A0A1I4UB55_9FLAO|nr:hypothetical protein SAMN05444143_10387 [Flavobacterium succinicans]